MAPFEPIRATLACLLGLAMGAVFFGGLWWTVRRGVASLQPAAWFLPSFLARMAAMVLGFYYVSNEGLYAIVACLLGFIAARVAVTWLTRSSSATAEVSHPT